VRQLRIAPAPGLFEWEAQMRERAWRGHFWRAITWRRGKPVGRPPAGC
jgi:hypothetical protein